MPHYKVRRVFDSGIYDSRSKSNFCMCENAYHTGRPNRHICVGVGSYGLRRVAFIILSLLRNCYDKVDGRNVLSRPHNIFVFTQQEKLLFFSHAYYNNLFGWFIQK